MTQPHTTSRTMASSCRRPSHATFGSGLATTLATITIILLNCLEVGARGVTVEPTPARDVGIMTSESKYFNCKGEKSDSITWIGPNGQEITNDGNQRIYVVHKKNMVKLEIKAPTKADSGTYRCVSKNRNRQETGSVSFQLHVFNPTVISGTVHYTRSEGAHFNMDCIATSDKDAQVDFSWSFGTTDLATEPTKYSISQQASRASEGEIRTVSRLDLRNVTKEQDGKYLCSVETTNKFISDSKELKIQLRVQYKPKFDEKTPKYIWVSEEAVQLGGPLTVNISCIVAADPVAKIQWFHGLGRDPINPGNRIKMPGMGNVIPTVADNENLSVLSLQFRSIEDIKNPRSGARNHKYTCRASNEQGDASNTFEIKVGRIPDPPQILDIEYREGSIVLHLNESNVEPQVDIYRLEIVGLRGHLFNKTSAGKENANNTYVIELGLSRGEHKVHIFAHNPVGWSENHSPTQFLNVVSGSPSLTTSWMATLLFVGIGQLMMEGNVARFFIGSLLKF